MFKVLTWRAPEFICNKLYHFHRPMLKAIHNINETLSSQTNDGSVSTAAKGGDYHTWLLLIQSLSIVIIVFWAVYTSYI